MKYKVGDRVRIKDDISNHHYRDFGGSMCEWQGKVMTIRDVCDDYYKMEEDVDNMRISGVPDGWHWYEDMIAGLAVPELTNTEILKEAIAVFGEDEQIRMCHEEMDELGVALSKYHRNPCDETKADVQEEIADAKIMLHQMSMIFGENDTARIQLQKIKQLKERIDDEKEVEIVYGQHKLGGREYVWINPNKYLVRVGEIATAETKRGEYPIIVSGLRTDKFKNVKHHCCITGGVQK